MRISDWSSDVCSSDLHAVRRRSAPLAKDSLRPGKGDDVVHGQEIIGIVALGDETEFFFQRLAHFQGKARAIAGMGGGPGQFRSEEHTSELQSLMRISYAVFCLKKKNQLHNQQQQI